jgi:omega-6 fatty acid desaturase (delta-12 desaturase)
MSTAAAVPMTPASTPERSEKELLIATKAFTVEDKARSRRESIISFAVQIAVTAAIVVVRPWPLQLLLSVVAGLLVVRTFILYHDVMHGAMHRGQKVWRAIYSAYGVLVLTPPNVWKETHNYHHAHTAKLIGSNIGSYPMATPKMYASLSPTMRWLYRAARHPLNVSLAVVTAFLIGMCVRPFLRQPKKMWDSALAFVLFWAISITLGSLGYWNALVFAYWLPLAIGCALGAYLFYAQHNYPGVKVAPRETWTFKGASLDSSSYMKMGPVMNWFTANIGYHHVHHLNAAIPYYRLPEAMASIPELQKEPETSLHLKDIVAAFRLKLWDPEKNEMVGY